MLEINMNGNVNTLDLDLNVSNISWTLFCVKKKTLTGIDDMIPSYPQVIFKTYCILYSSPNSNSSFTGL